LLIIDVNNFKPKVMKLQDAKVLQDTRTQCFSMIYESTTGEYLELIERAYFDKGGLAGQREPLKSSSALRIRKRMVEDIVAGTVLPPIVVGLIVNPDLFSKLKDFTPGEFSKLLEEIPTGNLTIIDGMQRTTALLEAIDKGLSKDRLIRIEFWSATQLNSLIYRMLILNTGQVPWNIRRQVETVFSSMINEIKEQVPELEIYNIDDKNRRSKAGQYHANEVIELYLAFGGRKEKVDTKERLADEFTRLDFIEVTENENFSKIFYNSLKYLGLIDIEFSRLGNVNPELRFAEGQDLFKSQPARVGFITAIAKEILGRPGTEKPIDKVEEDSIKLFKEFELFIKRIKDLNPGDGQLEHFLQLTLLSEKLSTKSGKVGDFEREYFTKAFETLIELKFQVSSLGVCWLAY
jgi:hypothetical protein